MGPPAAVEPEKVLARSKAIDFVVRGEFDYQVVDFAQRQAAGRTRGSELPQNGGFVHNRGRPGHRESRRVALGHQGLPARPGHHALQRPVPAAPVPGVLHLARLPGHVHLLPVAADALRPSLAAALGRRRGKRGALRAETFPDLREIFFDDDTFNYQKARTIEVCRELKPLKATWSCTSRVTTDYETLKAMKEAGCRLLIVGYESGDAQILKNIKKGATVEMALRFTENAKKLGLAIHGDFIVGLPGETRESPAANRRFRQAPGRRDRSRFRSPTRIPARSSTTTSRQNGLITVDSMTDEKRPPAPQHHLPRPGPRRAGGLGGALLRRVLLPAARRLAFRAQGDVRLRRTPPPLQGSPRVSRPARPSARSSSSRRRRDRPPTARRTRRYDRRRSRGSG